ncbi:MAG: hypothetical protein BWY06_01606 [Candidatus Latescibacteria bacterium ADurb.Bin168]|nr:MAG: hypothetical protein BWY06_01606 [Candidatus Latescibacteria bacterium ADurb.Bin168]
MRKGGLAVRWPHEILHFVQNDSRVSPECAGNGVRVGRVILSGARDADEQRSVSPANLREDMRDTVISVWTETNN